MKKKIIKKVLKLVCKGFTTIKGLKVLSWTIIGMFLAEVLAILIMVIIPIVKIKNIIKDKKHEQKRNKRKLLKECRLQYKKQLLNELNEDINNIRKTEIINEINRLEIQFGI